MAKGFYSSAAMFCFCIKVVHNNYNILYKDIAAFSPIIALIVEFISVQSTDKQ